MLPDLGIAEQPRNERDVVVGDDVWLGARVFVGAGVTIGSGTVVSANSVVTRDLPEGVIAVGIPARVVRRREDLAERPQLEEVS
jgi:acetyltransferase-like isoleucine patch superfamily enzyme